MIGRGLLRRLWRARRGVAMLEFALILPLFLGFLLSGIEMANYIMANNRVQRLAAMASDLVGQSGAGTIGDTEAQIYDLFSALDLTAHPFELREHGRIVITAVRGTDNNNDGTVENRIIWQRFDGNYVAGRPVVGCHEDSPIASLPNNRRLALDEIMFHVQVTYEYQPVFSSLPFSMLNLPATFERHAMFRARSNQFQRPIAVDNFPAKDDCDTASGL